MARRRHLLKSPYVFCNKDGKRFNDLRHTFASHLVMRGVGLRAVQELLGHRDMKLTMRYARLAPGIAVLCL